MHYWVAKTCKNQRQMIKCHIAYKVYYCVHSNRFDMKYVVLLFFPVFSGRYQYFTLSWKFK